MNREYIVTFGDSGYLSTHGPFETIKEAQTYIKDYAESNRNCNRAKLLVLHKKYYLNSVIEIQETENFDDEK